MVEKRSIQRCERAIGFQLFGVVLAWLIGCGGGEAASTDASATTEGPGRRGRAPISGLPDMVAASDGGPDASMNAPDGGPAICAHATCGGECVDLRKSLAHCGRCGYACLGGRTCAEGRCTPAWLPVSRTGAPTPRIRHSAAFVAGRVLVAGGALPNNTGSLKDAYFYDPAADAWSKAPALNQARCAHNSVAIGDRVVVFGGLSDCSNGSLLGPGLEEFTPAAGAWTVVNAPGGPGLRYNGAAVALPTAEMLVLGGNGGTMVPAGRYAPDRQAWRDASCSLPNCSTDWMAAFVLDQNTVVAWGGYGNAAGQQLDLRTNTWAPWTRPPGTPSATGHPTLYTESRDRWFLLEGQDCASDVVVNIFDKATAKWTIDRTSLVEGVGGFSAGTVNAAWTGSEVFVWSGQCRGEPHGARYQPPAP